MGTRKIKKRVLIAVSGWSIGVLISVLTLGKMTFVAWASLMIEPLIIFAVWRHLRPLPYYSCHPYDCCEDHEEKDFDYICSRCGVEVEVDWF